MTKSVFLVPTGYKTFKCKGGDCRACCCSGWAITVSMKEYFDLLSLSCSKELRYRIDGALHLIKGADEERYAQILPTYLGDCPMRREDGLCGLQCECGEESLPAVCRLYPRSPRLYPDAECCLSCSCEKVIEDLIETTGKLSLERLELDFDPVQKEIPKPEFYDEYRRKCLDMIQDETMSLSRRLDKIYAFLDGGRYDKKSMEEIVAVLLDFFGDSPSIGEECRAAIEKEIDLPSCVVETARKFPLVETWVGKILTNHFFFEKFPFPERGESLSDVGKGLSGLCLLWLVLLTGDNIRSKEDFVDLTGKFFRVVEHTRFYKNVALLIDRTLETKNM